MSFSRRNALQLLSTAPWTVPFISSELAHATGDPAALPKRYVFVLKSSGVDKENLIPAGLKDQWGTKREKYVEASFADHELPDNFKAFEEIKEHLTIVQGLSGKNFVGNHTAGYGALSCHHSEQVAVAPTVDCLLGQKVSTGPYKVYGMAMNGPLLEQYTKRPGDSYCYPNISAMKKGQPVAFQASPKKAFVELFGSAVATPEQIKRKLTLNTNLMDFMKEDAKRIEKQLSADEKDRFAHYTQAFESLRIREKKKVTLADRIKKHAPSLSNRYESMVPSVRMDLHFELASAALIAGLTNVITLRPDTLGIIYSDLGISQHVHAIGHLGNGKTANGWDGPRARKEIDKLQLNYVAKMAKKLKSVPEGNGTMLDNTIIVYTSCAGGQHHDGQRDWPFVLVGGINHKFKTGRYLQFPSYEQPGHRTIANLYISLMQSAGIETGEHFGQLDSQLKHLDLKGPLTELS